MLPECDCLSAISDQSESRYAHMFTRITSDQIGSDEPIWSENALGSLTGASLELEQHPIKWNHLIE
jgi:hypothetical protein